jgi:hypothetical protein
MQRVSILCPKINSIIIVIGITSYRKLAVRATSSIFILASCKIIILQENNANLSSNDQKDYLNNGGLLLCVLGLQVRAIGCIYFSHILRFRYVQF